MQIRTTSFLNLMDSICSDGACSGHYSNDLKNYGEMRTCQMNARSSEVFDKAPALGWVIGEGGRTESPNFHMILTVSRLLLSFATLQGFACFNQRTWGLPTSKEDLFPVKDIDIHDSSNQNKKRVLSPSGSVFHMMKQCQDAARIFPH